MRQPATAIHATSITTSPGTAVACRDAAPTGYSTEQVVGALHRAAHDIVCATSAGEGLYDALDLMITTTVGYLTGQAHTLQQVVDQSYESTLPTILGWITQATTR
jgi:hypothetical protein